MKKILLSLLTLALFTACQKEISGEASPEIAEAKFILCHYDVVTGISKTIEVNQNALAAHLAHGDMEGDCSAVLTTICDQDWMVKNLDVDHYRNGEPIPQVTNPSAWMGLTTGAWCYYNNNPANGAIYGKLYNWYAVNDPRGLAPRGWHVPSDGEWNSLAKCLDPNTNVNVFNQSPIAGGAMKETGSTHWIYPNTGATNSSRFTGLPGGYRMHSGFDHINIYGLWWSSSERNIAMGDVWTRLVSYADGYINSVSNFKSEGHSVRCLRD